MRNSNRMRFARMSALGPTKSDENSNFPVPPPAADGPLCPTPTYNLIQLHNESPASEYSESAEEVANRQSISPDHLCIPACVGRLIEWSVSS